MIIDGPLREEAACLLCESAGDGPCAIFVRKSRKHCTIFAIRARNCVFRAKNPKILHKIRTHLNPYTPARHLSPPILIIISIFCIIKRDILEEDRR